MRQRLPGHLRLLEDIGGAGRRQNLCVPALVIIGSGRQRNEHCRRAGRSQLGQRRGTGPADHEVGGFHLAVHGEQERLDPRREAGAPVGVADVFQIALSCLMRDCQPAGVRCQPRRRLHHGHVDCVRALGAPKDQHPRGAIVRRRRSMVKELGTNRIACDKAPPPEVRQRRLVRDSCSADKRREPAIGEAGHGVLLEQERRNPPERRHQHDRTRAVPPDANHQLRPPARDDVPRVEPAERQERQPARQRRRRHALQTGAAQQIQIEAFARHDAALDAAGRPRKAHRDLRHPAPQLASHGDPRYKCPPVPPPAMTTRRGVMHPAWPWPSSPRVPPHGTPHKKTRCAATH